MQGSNLLFFLVRVAWGFGQTVIGLHLITRQNFVFNCFVFSINLKEYESAEANKSGCCPDMEYFTGGLVNHFSSIKIFSLPLGCCLALCCEWLQCNICLLLPDFSLHWAI